MYYFKRAEFDKRIWQSSVDIFSHARWIAALVVVVSHIQQNIIFKSGFIPYSGEFPQGLITKQLLRPEGYGHAAVIIFFVLSGFLVGNKLINLYSSSNVDAEWPSFLVDRFARIFVVLWPAVVLTGIVFLGLMTFTPDATFVKDGNWAFDLLGPISNDHFFSRWVGAVFLFNEFFVPTLETNSPLWSLSYEWFYYIIALGSVLILRRVLSIGAILIISYGTLLLYVSARVQPDVIFSGINWIFGLLARVAFNNGMLSGWMSRVLGIASVFAILFIEKWHQMPDVVLGATLAFMFAHSSWAQWRFFGIIGEKLASFSYSLYATHFPVMLAVMGALFLTGNFSHPLPRDADGLIIAGIVLVITIAVARVFAEFTEYNTKSVKIIINKLLNSRNKTVDMS